MILSDYNGIILRESTELSRWDLPAFFVEHPGGVESFYGETAHSDAERMWHDLVIKKIYCK